MAKINKKELKAMNVTDLNKHLDEMNRELLGLRSQVASGARLENPGRVSAVKRNKARIMTLLNQKKVEEKSKKS